MTKGHYFNDNCYIVMWSDNETMIVNLKKDYLYDSISKGQSR